MRSTLCAQFVCEVGRGELVEVGPQGIVKTQLLAPSPAPAPCMFELIYFARPDSVVFGIGAQRARIEMGRELALQDRDLPMPDLVVPIPDSGVAAATGYAQTSGVPFEMALCAVTLRAAVSSCQTKMRVAKRCCQSCLWWRNRWQENGSCLLMIPWCVATPRALCRASA